MMLTRHLQQVRCIVLLTALSVYLPVHAADDHTVTANELHALIQAGKAPVIVDVRSVAEYRAGHVPGALHVPFWTAFWKADEIPASGHDAVVVYCAHGPRASLAGWALGLAGIPNIIHLKGHMTGWRRQALPETKGEQPGP